MDEDGEIYHYGRMNDDIALPNNIKLKLPLIANEIIYSHPAIFDCLVVKLPLTDGTHAITAHLSIKEKDYYLADEAINAAEEKIALFLPSEFELAGYVAYKGMLPPSPVGKRSREILINQPKIFKPAIDGMTELLVTKLPDGTFQIDDQEKDNKLQYSN